jgi:hypothetical protein
MDTTPTQHSTLTAVEREQLARWKAAYVLQSEGWPRMMARGLVFARWRVVTGALVPGQD